jgi:hypothetical protein
MKKKPQTTTTCKPVGLENTLDVDPVMHKDLPGSINRQLVTDEPVEFEK